MGFEFEGAQARQLRFRDVLANDEPVDAEQLVPRWAGYVGERPVVYVAPGQGRSADVILEKERVATAPAWVAPGCADLHFGMELHAMADGRTLALSRSPKMLMAAELTPGTLRIARSTCATQLAQSIPLTEKSASMLASVEVEEVCTTV